MGGTLVTPPGLTVGGKFPVTMMGVVTMLTGLVSLQPVVPIVSVRKR